MTSDANPSRRDAEAFMICNEAHLPESPILNPSALIPGDLDACEEPFALFSQWLAAAREREINDPEAMSLATVDANGLPDVRIVLCKGVEADALKFYTNWESAKGRQLEARPTAAALFHWKSLRLQARFRGGVSRFGGAEADEYFHSRARASQLGAWASRQSQPLDSRTTLEKRAAEYAERFTGEVPRPEYWGGYRLTPSEIELWADGQFRLHDRVRFTRQGTGWARQRLYP
jgi:pyridoxamine 5'-phosphate oxidase